MFEVILYGAWWLKAMLYPALADARWRTIYRPPAHRMLARDRLYQRCTGGSSQYSE
jgi:hypothetical protein